MPITKPVPVVRFDNYEAPIHKSAKGTQVASENENARTHVIYKQQVLLDSAPNDFNSCRTNQRSVSCIIITRMRHMKANNSTEKQPQSDLSTHMQLTWSVSK